jgi:hypothetical protein
VKVLVGVEVGDGKAQLLHVHKLGRELPPHVFGVHPPGGATEQEGAEGLVQTPPSVEEGRDLGSGQERRVLPDDRQMDAHAEGRVVGQQMGHLRVGGSDGQHRRAGDDPLSVPPQDALGDALRQPVIVGVHDEERAHDR